MSSIIRLHKLDRLQAAVETATTQEDLRQAVQDWLKPELEWARRERQRLTLKRHADRLARLRARDDLLPEDF